MHIPDGLLNVGTLAGTAVISTGGVANAVRLLGRRLGEKQVPLIGIMAAFVFAVQMLNFPVAGGTSGHFLGAALCAILLGPWSAVIIISLVLAAQCFIFQDGGLLALGANIFNMALVGGLSAYLIYRIGSSYMPGNQLWQKMVAFAAAWLSVVMASVVCALELTVSGVSPLALVLPAMAGTHAIIGLVEGIITVAAVSLIGGTRPDLLKLSKI